MNIEEIIREENKVYCKPELLEEVHMHYCPGCSHGVIHKLVAEVIAEMGITERTVGVSPMARKRALHISGRRRHVGYRHCRVYPCRQPRREYRHDICK